jgi:hypothetical protein
MSCISIPSTSQKRGLRGIHPVRELEKKQLYLSSLDRKSSRLLGAIDLIFDVDDPNAAEALFTIWKFGRCLDRISRF